MKVQGSTEDCMNTRLNHTNRAIAAIDAKIVIEIVEKPKTNANPTKSHRKLKETPENNGNHIKP